MDDEMKPMAEMQARGPRSNQKLKILYLVKILMDNTDANHDITLQEIIDKLAANNVTAERKSVYDDIARLDDFGIKIKKTQYGKTYHYQVINRTFELAELKLLVEASKHYHCSSLMKWQSIASMMKMEKKSSENMVRYLSRNITIL